MNYKDLEQQFLDRRISRRQFLAGAAALGAVSLASGVINNPALAAPKKGGRLRVGIGHGSTTDSLDPATYENDQIIAHELHLQQSPGRGHRDRRDGAGAHRRELGDRRRRGLG
ncbi:MAG: twin-arginine translocation signal domain-containing protein [Halofilum sp. (in: g-proteobacteria)]|nr:twin-arginine translocation signal domain-containing protein [Halofilum sp. (in: g-proteobacteria)]